MIFLVTPLFAAGLALLGWAWAGPEGAGAALVAFAIVVALLTGWAS